MKTNLSSIGVIALTLAIITFPTACQTGGGGGNEGNGGGNNPPGGGTADTTAPSAATDLTATVISISQIELSWTACTDNVGVDHYKIYRDGVEIGTNTTNSYSDSGLTLNTTYCYTVKAVDAAGNMSADSNQACATPTDTEDPTPVGDLASVLISNSQVDLSWTASADNVGVTGYKIFRDGIEIDTTTITSYSDTGLAFNTFYCYKVYAFDAAGNVSIEGNEECQTTNFGYNGIKWKYDTGNSIYYSAPAIASDGTIYVGDVASGTTPRGLYAINPDGTLKWKYEITGARPVRSSPAVDALKTIYVATKASGTADAELLVLNPDGTLKWSYTVGQADIYCSPAIGENGKIYFGAENGIFYALNTNGTEYWKYATGNGINWTSPAIDIDGTIYIGNTDGFLFAINSDSFGLINSTWPKFRLDNKNTGRKSP